MMRWFFIMLLMAHPALAEQSPPAVDDVDREHIVAGLSQNRVSITANFDGSEILIYGAVKRDAPAPAGSRLNVIVTVEGPPTEQIVRKKDRRFGIWVNTDEVVIDQAPSFYAIAATGPVGDVLSNTEDLRNRVSIPRAIRAVDISAEDRDAPQFLEALLRIRVADGQYTTTEKNVSLTEDTLFRADVKLPANLIEGNYRVRIFLTRNGRVVDKLERRINVQKAGLEQFAYNLAHQKPLLYGMLSLLLAVGAGWGASAAFRFLRL